QPLNIRCNGRCRPARRHISFLASSRRQGTRSRHEVASHENENRQREPDMSTAHLLPAFAPVDLAFDHGEGCWLTGTTGERYLDFTSGVAVNALGHAHPKVADAIAAQAHKAIHVSNLFRVPEQEKLADRLCAECFADYVFFANSGAEAMEGAI